MKTIALLAALLVSQDTGGKIQWSKDVQDTLAAAKKAGKPAMLYFTASW